jgi:hypothetical protein
MAFGDIFGTYNNRVDPGSVSAPPQVQAPVITASRVPSPARGNTASFGGGVYARGYGVNSNFNGNLSLGFIASIVVLIMLFYAWTRNVQGG